MTIEIFSWHSWAYWSLALSSWWILSSRWARSSAAGTVDMLAMVGEKVGWYVEYPYLFLSLFFYFTLRYYSIHSMLSSIVSYSCSISDLLYHIWTRLSQPIIHILYILAYIVSRPSDLFLSSEGALVSFHLAVTVSLTSRYSPYSYLLGIQYRSFPIIWGPYSYLLDRLESPFDKGDSIYKNHRKCIVPRCAQHWLLSTGECIQTCMYNKTVLQHV